MSPLASCLLLLSFLLFCFLLCGTPTRNSSAPDCCCRCRCCTCVYVERSACCKLQLVSHVHTTNNSTTPSLLIRIRIRFWPSRGLAINTKAATNQFGALLLKLKLFPATCCRKMRTKSI